VIAIAHVHGHMRDKVKVWKRSTMRSILGKAFLGALAAVSAQAAETPAVNVGMSPQEVIAAIGQPDRIAVLEGKYLRDVPLAAAPSSNPEGRFVFIYRASGVNVWFTHGRASGLSQGGEQPTNPTGGAKSD
jgi:hypothetical protein